MVLLEAGILPRVDRRHATWISDLPAATRRGRHKRFRLFFFAGGIIVSLARMPATMTFSLQRKVRMVVPRVVLVGGFLGAGKTTLLAQAAARLTQRGRRVGLVANDQAADLVDTALLREAGSAVEEVAGGCFCCRFPDMLAAMQRLVEHSGVDVLIGEPVGSCTDLSATVLQPIKRLHRAQFTVAPFSVLVDANQVHVLARLHRSFDPPAAESPPPFPESVLYIYQKQLEEADLIVLNKADLLPPGQQAELRATLAARFSPTPVVVLSALTGEGVEAWLDLVERGERAGEKIAEVDYDVYAAGEACLGWMNASARLDARSDVDWEGIAGELLESIRAALAARSAHIAHLKLYLTTRGAHVAGNVTNNDAPLSLRGSIDPTQRSVALLINARVHSHPDLLQRLIEESLERVTQGRIDVTITQVRSFFPSRPVPVHRDQVVV